MLAPKKNGDSSSSNDQDHRDQQHHAASSSNTHNNNKNHPLFDFMARYPWPFLIVAPLLFAILIHFGFQGEDIVESEVANIWIAQKGGYAQDAAYGRSVGAGKSSTTNLASMAISRDGTNLLQRDRLELIRERMQAAESLEIEHLGVKYTWDDFCAVNSAPYRFPCLRLTPMDLFQEAQWTFTEADKVQWYESVIQNLLLKPRLPRFGVMVNDCASDCQSMLALRTQPEALGLSPNLTNPLLLFSDIGAMELSDPCRICIEETYETTISRLHASIAPTFGLLAQDVARSSQAVRESGDDPAKATRMAEMALQLLSLAESITTDQVVEFYTYYVVRTLYAQLGSGPYLENYPLFDQLLNACPAIAGLYNLTCPPLTADMNEEVAVSHLLAHADAPFSSFNTAGSPFHFWDQDGNFVGGNGPVGPLGGSGIEMSADMFSLAGFVDLANTEERTPRDDVDLESEEFQTRVATNPLFAWFMATVTPAEAGQECGGETLLGASTGLAAIDDGTAAAAEGLTNQWCNDFVNVPEKNPTKKDFAKLWFDLLMASEPFLNVKPGQDDPYTWTTGAGCDYSLAGERFSYENATEEDILLGASRIVYNIDEGTSAGAIDRNILIGGATPSVSEYSYENPLEKVTVIQTLYAALTPEGIVKRVQNCHRPGGAVDVSYEEAEELLFKWKEAQEGVWNEGWDDPSAGDVQFVSFYDDQGGVVGSTGRMLTEITLDNSVLTAVSIVIIALFSALFLFSPDLVASRILIALIGVALVVISFFAALGFGILTGIKMNVTIAWTLPFVIIGLGVDDVYIILLSLKNQGGYTERHWQDAMKEVVVPVTMTSLVNASMFAVLNVSDIPAIYLSSRVACYAVLALYFSVIFCYPAYCYLDLKRQEAGRRDIIVCSKSEERKPAQSRDFRDRMIYDNFYKPLVLNDNPSIRAFSHFVVFLLSFGLLAVGAYGMTKVEVGLGLEDFFPSSNPASQWALSRTSELASWSVAMNWGELSYTEPETQLGMISQFERVISTPYMAEVDTNQLWMSKLLTWSSRHCTDNFDRSSFDVLECGADQAFEDDGYCAGTWVVNDLPVKLRLKNIADPFDVSETCSPYSGGICLPGDKMHPQDLEDMGLDPTDASIIEESYCPVISDWSDDKWEFCVRQWRNVTGTTAGGFLTEPDTATPTECSGVDYADAKPEWPIRYSNGPTMFAFDLFSHQDTLDMMTLTREICDDDAELHCWMNGIPYDYWSQYEGIFEVLLQLSGYATLVGIGISFLFFAGSFTFEAIHERGSIFVGSAVGALLIGVSIVATLVPVVGLSVLVGVNLTGFSNMAFVLSVGFAVEYSVHIVSRFMRADDSYATALERVEFTMSFLTLPTFMSFVSSTIGVICLAFTEFEFNLIFFFRPLIIVMFVSYWFGCWFLPVLLVYLDFDVMKMGREAAEEEMGERHVKDLQDSGAEPEDVKGSDGSPVDHEESYGEA